MPRTIPPAAVPSTRLKDKPLLYFPYSEESAISRCSRYPECRILPGAELFPPKFQYLLKIKQKQKPQNQRRSRSDKPVSAISADLSKACDSGVASTAIPASEKESMYHRPLYSCLKCSSGISFFFFCGYGCRLLATPGRIPALKIATGIRIVIRYLPTKIPYAETDA